MIFSATLRRTGLRSARPCRRRPCRPRRSAPAACRGRSTVPGRLGEPAGRSTAVAEWSRRGRSRKPPAAVVGVEQRLDPCPQVGVAAAGLGRGRRPARPAVASSRASQEDRSRRSAMTVIGSISRRGSDPLTSQCDESAANWLTARRRIFQSAVSGRLAVELGGAARRGRNAQWRSAVPGEMPRASAASLDATGRRRSGA